MKEKLTLEEFIKIREELEEFIESLEEEGISEEEAEKRYSDFSFERIKRLTTYDLSDIPAEEFRLVILVPDNKELSFEGTKANIDFRNIAVFLGSNAKLSFKECNLSNIRRILREIDYEDIPEVFGEDYQEKYPHVFLDDSFTEEFRRKYYRNEVTLEDIDSLPDEQIDKLDFRSLSIAYDIAKIVKSFNLEKNDALKLYKRNKELFYLIVENEAYDLFPLESIEDINEEVIDETYQKIEKKVKNRDVRYYHITPEKPYAVTRRVFPTYFIENYTDNEELIRKFNNEELTYQDIVENREIFDIVDPKESIPYTAPNQLASIIGAIGYKRLMELADEYPDTLKYLFDEKNKDLRIISPGMPISERNASWIIKDSVKDYLIREINNGRMDQIPEEFHDFYERYEERITDPEQLHDAEKLLILDVFSEDLIRKLGRDNLYRMSKETNLFKIKSKGKTILEYLYEENRERELLLPDNIGSYHGLVDYMIARFNDSEFSFNIDSEEEPDLSKIAPDMTVPEEFKRLSRFDYGLPKNLTDAEREYLLTHNLRYRFSRNRDFVSKFCEKLGNERFLDFISENEAFFLCDLDPNITISDDMEETTRNFYTSIYNKLVEDNYNSIYRLLDDEKFIKFYPKLDISEFDEPVKRILLNGRLGAQMVKDNPELVDKFKAKEFDFMTRLREYKKIGLDEQTFYGLAPKYGKFLDYCETRVQFENIEERSYQRVVAGELYDESYKELFKNHPEMFCAEDTPEEIKRAFYDKTIVINEENIHYFDDTDIGFASPESEFLIGLQLEGKSNRENNLRKMKILQQLRKIRKDDDVSKKEFKEFIKNNYQDLTDENIEEIGEIFNRISYTNSSELYRIREELEKELLSVEEPLEKLDTIETVFLQNHIPNVAKRFIVFKTIHPQYEIRDQMSPVLKRFESHEDIMDTVLFADLIKITLESDNRNFGEYLKTLEYGERLYREILDKNLDVENLSEPEKMVLDQFIGCLKALYDYSNLPDKKEVKLSNDRLKNIQELSVLLKVDDGTTLSDRIVKMYCHFAGINTVEEAKTLMRSSIEEMNERNKDRTEFSLEEGDLIKGIKDFRFLSRILDNGSVAADFLGCDANTDATPLDTDCSLITKTEGSIEERMKGTKAKGYGNIHIVIKKDKLLLTRDDEGNNKEQPKRIRDVTKQYELFRTLDPGHYGIRTGIPSTYIDYIITEKYDSRIGFELARKGMYIPVVDRTGKLVFTYDDYQGIREKMGGLSYYGTEEYKLSENLESPEILKIKEGLKDNEDENDRIRAVINKAIEKACIESGIPELRHSLSADVREGFAELIDTGSTGRGTNKPKDSDFDFIMRLDKKVKINDEEMARLKKNIRKELNKEEIKPGEETGDGDFRFTDVELEGLDEPIKIDISFKPKLDNIEYTTDLCIKDRLQNIREQYGEEKYQLVIANIIMAKAMLKEGGCYKKTGEHGLGGVGVENWILQHGGSLLDACISFKEAADSSETFEEFQEKYPIWDFGENFTKEEGINHDDFTRNNLREDAYERMKKVVNAYIEKQKKKDDLVTMLETPQAPTEIIIQNKENKI